MKTLVFDTETNGKRQRKPKGHEIDPAAEPAVIQLAAILYDGDYAPGDPANVILEEWLLPRNADGTPAPVPEFLPQLNELMSKAERQVITDAENEIFTNLLKDADFFIDKGLTQENIDQYGKPYEEVFPQFAAMLEQADRLIAHNIYFDLPIIRAGLMRAGLPVERLETISAYCTMRTLEPILKLPSDNDYSEYKFPTLEESYKHMVNSAGFKGAHSADADTAALAEIAQAVDAAGIAMWQYEYDLEERPLSAGYWPFGGKHKGAKLCDVPTSYLSWATGERGMEVFRRDSPKFNQVVEQAVAAEMQRRLR